VKDVHLGVVSSDMGLVGVSGIKDCAGFGDDGVLQHAPTADPNVVGCQTSYPPFLSLATADPLSDELATADDLQCIAALGAGGCGFEQPLEAALKALWPAVDPMPPIDGGNRITFFSDSDGNGQLGHGDDRLNGGFLRNDPAKGLSMIAVVVLTDEDDGSSQDTSHFTPPQDLEESSPLYDQPLNLRNFYNPDALYPVARYVAGLRALRPSDERLVVFGAIGGVPPELVTRDQTRDVGSDAMVRDAFYDAVLDAPGMQERVEPESTTSPANGNLAAACETPDAAGEPNGKAYPSRRLVEVARGFGAQGFVDSVCQQDYQPAIDQLIDRVAARPNARCLDRPLVRDDDGLVPRCKLLWVLPEESPESPAETPHDCDDAEWRDVLDPAGPEYERSGIPEGRLCRFRQLPVQGGEVGPDSSDMGTRGWYYDDFSDEADRCSRSPARVAFTDEGRPSSAPQGVRVILDCE
jgi:hypothetical protein